VNLETAFELLGLGGSLAALVCALALRGGTLGRAARTALVLLAVVSTVKTALTAWEWSGLPSPFRLDPVADHLNSILPLAWFFFLYAASSDAAASELRREAERLSAALEQLRQVQEQVLRDERLRALGEMSSGVAHDFNNILTAILGHTELLLMDAEERGDAAHTKPSLEAIRAAARSAADVVHRLREFYRKPDEAESGLAPVRLADVVEEAVRIMQPIWQGQAQARGAAIAIRTDLQPAPPVLGKRSDFLDALTNILMNAFDAMPDGGEILIRLRPDGRDVLLTVRDTGVGMDDDVKRRCLEPFFTTKKERGSGLGLPLAYGVATRHRGAIHIESAPGRGTEVTLVLPGQHLWQGELSLPDAEAAPPRSLSILLADDDPFARAPVEGILRRDGHRVESFASGNDAVKAFQPGAYDVAILDRAMPGMSGDETAAALRRIDGTLPIILFTGFGVFMKATGDAPAHIDVLLPKPAGQRELRDALRRVACHRQAPAS